MPVAFEELAGSPTLRIVDGKLSGVRRFKVAWHDRIGFALELLGGYRLIGGAFSYTPPAVLPGAPQAIVREIEIEPFPSDAATHPPANLAAAESQYPFALIAATYVIPDHGNQRPDSRQRPDLPPVPPGTFLSYHSDLGAEYLTIPGRVWVWDGTDERVPPDVNPGILVPTEDLRLTWERVPLPPWDAIRDKRGLVNSTQFLNHAAGTVLFCGARTAREFQLQGDGLWRLDYHFKVREVPGTASPGLRYGWNHFYRAVSSGERWQKISVAGSAAHEHPYAETTFDELFAFGS